MPPEPCQSWTSSTDVRSDMFWKLRLPRITPENVVQFERGSAALETQTNAHTTYRAELHRTAGLFRRNVSYTYEKLLEFLRVFIVASGFLDQVPSSATPHASATDGNSQEMTESVFRSCMILRNSPPSPPSAADANSQTGIPSVRKCLEVRNNQ